MKFPDFSLLGFFFIFQNVFPDRGNPVMVISFFLNQIPSVGAFDVQAKKW